MLVLSRRKNESIKIGNDIEVTVVEVRGDKVRLGVEAPKNVSVHRREVLEAIQRERAAVHDTLQGGQGSSAQRAQPPEGPYPPPATPKE
jgi:carbon storage regulator